MRQILKITRTKSMPKSRPNSNKPSSPRIVRRGKCCGGKK
jgi:hypothetical protein